MKEAFGSLLLALNQVTNLHIYDDDQVPFLLDAERCTRSLYNIVCSVVSNVSRSLSLRLILSSHVEIFSHYGFPLWSFFSIDALISFKVGLFHFEPTFITDRWIHSKFGLRLGGPYLM